MFLRIFKRDLKRRKVMNAILVVFITIAAMFTASSIRNFFSIMAGVDYFCEISGTGDYLAFVTDEEEINSLKVFLENSEDVQGYRENTSLFLSSSNIELEAGSGEISDMQILETPTADGYKFFDADDKVLTVDTIKDGEIYLPESLLSSDEIKIGDAVTIKYGDKRNEFIVSGAFKDAVLGTGMGSGRMLVSANDFEFLLGDTLGTEIYPTSIFYIDTDNIKTVENYLMSLDHVQDKLERSNINMFYMIPMIISGIFLLAGIILMIVSFLIVRFSIAFSVQEEYREIGVMKAIGIGNRRIRRIFITKYVCFGFLGSAAGLALSFPFRALIRTISDSHMVSGDFVGPILNVAGAVFVFVLILLFAYRFTGIVKKSSPIDAIRNGQTGERYKRKSVLSLSKGKGKTSWFMALNDLLSSPRKYISMIVIFTLCILLTMILANTVSTLRSDDLIITCGFIKSDAYVEIPSEEMKDIFVDGSLKASEDVVKKVEEELNENGIPCSCHAHVKVDCTVTNGDATQLYMAKKPVAISVSDYVCYEGSTPTKPDEIAITKTIADFFDVGIGDSLTFDAAGGAVTCIITGLHDDMNSFGKSFLVHEDLNLGEKANYKFSGYVEITYTDNPTDDEKAKRIEKLKELYPDGTIYTAGGLADNITRCSDILDGVKYGLMGVTVVVILLAVILMERTFISDEKSQIALLKAVGFKNAGIISWHVIRFSLLSVASALLALILNKPVTALLLTPIFNMMGGRSIAYKIDRLSVYAVIPLLAVAATVLFTAITAQYSRTVKASDTASIE